MKPAIIRNITSHWKIWGAGLLLIFAAGCAGPRPTPLKGQTAPLSITGEAPFRTPQDLYHVMGPSETLWRISKTYNVDMNTLLRVNHLDDPTKVKKGQKLLIPQTHGPRPMIPLYPTRRWTHIVIHHTATHEGDAYSIDKLHHQRGFWNGLGYHFLIGNGTVDDTDGQIQVGPRWLKQLDGAHANADGMNQRGIGISIVGNYSEERLSEHELESLVFLVKTLMKYYGIPSQNVIRHSEVQGKHTECPGLRFPWADFKRRIQ